MLFFIAGSVQMGILGYFFKLSYVMKDYHKILTEDYKFSTWVSYAFFTAATILVGGLLGLVSNMIILLQTSALTFRVPRRNLIFRTALQAGFISGEKFNFCKSLGSKAVLIGGLLGLVSNIIILLQKSAFNFRVPIKNLIFITALQAGFISGKKFIFCKSLGSKTILVSGLLGLVSNMIISLQTSAFTFRVLRQNLIFRTALQAGFISGKKFKFCKSLGSNLS
jgi:hypothetical protein